MKFKVGNICMSMRIESNHIRERINLHYRKFISKAKPDLFIDVEHRDFASPFIKQWIYQTESWRLGRGGDQLFLYFPGRVNSSLARFTTQLKRIKFYTPDYSDQLLLYLLPELIFGFILPKFKGLILHACGVLDNKKGYLFIAPSGGGKSTIAKLALEDGRTVLNDDRMVIHKEENLFRIHSTPWVGDVKSTVNKNCIIKELFFLEKAEKNYIFPLKPLESMIKLIENSFYLAIKPEIKRKVFQLYFAMINKLRCYRLGFKPDRSIWRFLDGSLE